MPQVKYAIVSRSLKTFEQPDTSSHFEFRLPPGKYRVLDVKSNHPTGDTDYIHLEVPGLGDEETWICSRWQDQEYAATVVEEIHKRPLKDFSNDPMAIDEQELIKLLPLFHAFEYDLDRARYPVEISGFRTPLAPPYTNNCCTFVEGLIAGAWKNTHNYQWSKEKHGQMMIFSNDDFFSPVTCLLDSEIAVDLTDEDNMPPPWTVIQGWRKQWSGGHTFIILGHHEETDRILTLESNSAYRMNGVGYRMIGNLRDYPQPPANWWNREDLWTWERLKSVYRFRKMAKLKVNNLTWAGVW
ncbi:MAG: hypothetical protein RIC35_12610 [Marinoscillum sp.]